MTFTKTDVFKAFKRLHNEYDDGDIYLSIDEPEELLAEDEVDADLANGEEPDGVWVMHCCVWISKEQIKEYMTDG